MPTLADTKLSALSEVSVPTTDDLLYWVDDPAGTPVSNKASANRVGGLLARGIVQGRLTTESGVPVSTSDRTAQGTIYFTPYNGNLLTVYDGTRWKLYTFAEISLALTATSGKNYDVFVYDNAGTLTLELSAAWTTDTARADALALQDGVYVKSGTTTRRWLGTIRASASNATEDSVTKRFVWNTYNQVERRFFKSETTDSWTYNSTTWRSANNSTANRVELVCGLAISPLSLTVTNYGAYTSTPDNGNFAIAEDGTSSPHANNIGMFMAASTWASATYALCQLVPSIGYHYYQWIEQTGAVGAGMSFYGDAGIPGRLLSGITGTVVM